MSIRFTYALLIFSAVIVFCQSMKVTKVDYKQTWQCHWVCSMYNQGLYTLAKEACSILNGTPSDCEKKTIQLYEKGSWGRSKEIFEDHTLLVCVSDGTIVGHLTSGREKNEYLKWYENNGIFYPDEFVKYA